MRKALSLLLALLITGGGAAQTQDLPDATDAHGGFGLLNQSGNRLIVTASPGFARPELLKTAVCGGRRATVQFERRQKESPNNGRESAGNFDKLPGSVYTISGNAIASGEPCFLASDSLLMGSTIVSIAKPEGPGACAQRARFATLRDRPVVNCWPLARLESNKDVALLEFERRGKDALAALVVLDGERAMFVDFPAVFTAPGDSLWRVDDDGKLSPDAVKIVCVLQRGDWFALATAWAGAEGYLLSLWTVDRSDRFTKVLNDYWYHAPIAPVGISVMSR